MNLEIERKFLVLNETYKQAAVKAIRIRQGYIAHDAGRTVRVRIADDKGFLTIKGPSRDGISRQEWEREIPLQDAEDLMIEAFARIMVWMRAMLRRTSEMRAVLLS